ncbi:MAG: 8-oxoguanine DNA glycosylase [Lachnospiraceae bacterium]|nr:8-oxoguanine DNA glycosylase [Lachnospiraceae bacterium]
MEYRKINHLNLRQIAESGQCFRWKSIDHKTAMETYGVPADIVHDIDDMHKSDKGATAGDIYVIPPFGADQRNFGPLVMADMGDEFWSNADNVDWDGHWTEYFDMSTDYDDIERRIRASGDAHAKECYEFGRGIRILRQDLWEMMITFLISQNNNIGRIRNSVETIVMRHGGYFPRADEFDVGILNDKTVGLGYRAPYIKETVEKIKTSPNLLDELEVMNYEQAYDALTGYTGIGPKVANCICLFGLHHVEAFPVDTHVKQLLDRYYPNGFPYECYEGVAGIIQQYLFYYELKHK